MTKKKKSKKPTPKQKKVGLDLIYVPSEEIVARKIEGEIIIVPLTAGVGDMESEFYSLDETARAVWELLDGKRRLRDVAKALAREFAAPVKTIERDVTGLVRELVARRMLVEVGKR